MLIKADKAVDFYKGLVNLAFKFPSALPPEHVEAGVYSYLRGAWRRYQMFAMAALDLGFGLEVARGYLAESAGCYVELQRRTRKSSAPEVLPTFFRIATCHDQATAKAFAAAYLETPEGRRGESGPRLVTPAPDDHFWHLANALALFHAGEAKLLAEALKELQSLPPRKGFAHSGEWWKAIVALAVRCLADPTPSPLAELQVVAEVNQKMFAKDDKDFIYEAWFAEMAMAFAAAAQQRGFQVPDEDPHPSMPLGLLKLPKCEVPTHPWGALPPVDDELRKAIERAAKGGAKKAAAPAKKTAAKKTAAPAKKTATKKAR